MRLRSLVRVSRETFVTGQRILLSVPVTKFREVPVYPLRILKSDLFPDRILPFTAISSSGNLRLSSRILVVPATGIIGRNIFRARTFPVGILLRGFRTFPAGSSVSPGGNGRKLREKTPDPTVFLKIPSLESLSWGMGHKPTQS